MLERDQQRQKEKQDRINQELKEIEEARRIAEEDEKIRQERKENYKRNYERILEECEKAKELKAEEARKEREYEQVVMKQYADRLDAEDRRRSLAFKKRVDTLAAIGKEYESKGAGAREREENKKREDMIAAAIAIRNQEEEEKERAKRERQQRQALEALETNRKIMESKEAARLHSREEGIRLKNEIKVQVEEAKQSEIEAQRRRRQQMDVTRHRLEEQMAEQLPNKRGYRKTGQDLSEEEQAAVDKSLLKKVVEDPEFYRKVVEKINTTRAK